MIITFYSLNLFCNKIEKMYVPFLLKFWICTWSRQSFLDIDRQSPGQICKVVWHASLNIDDRSICHLFQSSYENLCKTLFKAFAIFSIYLYTYADKIMHLFTIVAVSRSSVDKQLNNRKYTYATATFKLQNQLVIKTTTICV